MLVDAGAGQAELRRPAAATTDPAPSADAVRPGPVRRHPRWLRRYRALLVAGDVLVGALAGLVMMLVRPGTALEAPYALLSLTLPAIWPLAQGIAGSYSPQFFGTG